MTVYCQYVQMFMWIIITIVINVDDDKTQTRAKQTADLRKWKFNNESAAYSHSGSLQSCSVFAENLSAIIWSMLFKKSAELNGQEMWEPVEIIVIKGNTLL